MWLQSELNLRNLVCYEILQFYRTAVWVFHPTFIANVAWGCVIYLVACTKLPWLSICNPCSDSQNGSQKLETRKTVEPLPSVPSRNFSEVPVVSWIMSLLYSRKFSSANTFVKATDRQFVRNLFSSKVRRRLFALRSFGRRSFAHRFSSHFEKT